MHPLGLGIGSVNVGRLLWLLCGDFGGPRVVRGGVGGCYFLRGDVSHPRGPTSPCCGRIFLVLISFSIGFVGILSPIIIIIIIEFLFLLSLYVGWGQE